MDTDQTRRFVAHAAALFGGVRQATSPPGADASEAQRDAWRIRLAAWGRTLADVDFDDAVRCLDAMHRGEAGDELKFPGDWADRFPATVRRWCRDHATPRRSDAPLRYAEDQRVKCRVCLDSGLVTVLNPAFADEHHNQLADTEPADVTDAAKMAEVRSWAKDARAWCRVNKVGPLIAVVVCSCDHPRACQRRERRDAWRRGEKLHKDDTGPSIQAAYDSHTMPIVRGFGVIDQFEALRLFEPAPAEVAYAWTP